MLQRVRPFALVAATSLTVVAFAMASTHAQTAPAAPAAPAAAPATELPAASELLAKHVTALGGKDAIASVKTLRFKGSLDSEMSAMEVDVATLAPSMIRIGYSMRGRHWETACDGTLAWATDPMGGPAVLLDDAVRDSMRSGVDFQGLFRSPDALFTDLTTNGSETIGGVECWTVSMKSKAGEPVTGFFAKSTGLFTAIRQTQMTQRGEATMAMRVTEWQALAITKADAAAGTPAKSIQVAKAIEITESGLRSTGTFTNFEVNTLDAAFFAAPQAVKDLAAAAPKAPAAPATPAAAPTR
jgi:hypothetical protein